MNATNAEIERLFAQYGIASLAPGGTSSRDAAQGGRIAQCSIARRGSLESLVVRIGEHEIERKPPADRDEALAIASDLRRKASFSEDAGFEHLVADLLVKATRLFRECEAARLELGDVHLHDSSYHIGKARLTTRKPLHVKARLQPDSHDRWAAFNHRHGDSTRFPK